jgi:hypothetical protein
MGKWGMDGKPEQVLKANAQGFDYFYGYRHTVQLCARKSGEEIQKN